MEGYGVRSDSLQEGSATNQVVSVDDFVLLHAILVLGDDVNGNVAALGGPAMDAVQDGSVDLDTGAEARATDENDQGGVLGIMLGLGVDGGLCVVDHVESGLLGAEHVLGETVHVLSSVSKN